MDNRKQFVRGGGRTFNSLSVSVEVTQESILAPTLFIIYLIDLLELLLVFLATSNDTTILAKHKIIRLFERVCSHDIGLIDRWSLENKLVISIKQSFL